MQVRQRAERPRIEPCGFGFADEQDHAYCQEVHRKFGTSYYFATRCFPPEIRTRTHAVYAFVRIPDEWVDNPGGMPPDEQIRMLDCWHNQLLRGVEGIRPEHPAMRAFCDVCHTASVPLEEPLRFLEAMKQDVSVTRYATYEDLCVYMRGSAAAVGIMMCRVMNVASDPETLAGAHALGEAMQLTNFLRDVGEDASRGRIYLPLEDLDTFGVTDSSILEGKVDDSFRNLMRFEIERARRLYAKADLAIPQLPRRCRPAVQLARRLYAKILDKIEENDYDVFTRRARTTKIEKLILAARTIAGT